MPKYRSATTTHGRNMAGARALWRATGMTEEDFGKPIIAVVNSFTQFVPGHVHLKDMGQLVAREIEAAGGVAKEFNTIAVDDGIAMGHGGMLYSLPSRDLIADSIESVVQAQWYDGVVTVVGCDKNMPGAIMAMARLDRPGIMVYGGTIRSGQYKGQKLDIVSAFEALGKRYAGNISDEDYNGVIKNSIPGAGACGGMYTANTMASSIEALGLCPTCVEAA